METTEWWLRPLAWVFARRPDWRDSFGRILLRIGNHFYVLLAILFALTGAWDQFVTPINPQLSNASFDWLMRHRPVAYKPDPDIVVLDIDEASLAGLSAQFGRWPWPRQVLADVAARLESSGTRAVAFDILFADPDVANPASEQAFDRYVAGSRNSFFTAARLNPKNDSKSQITVSMLNFAERDPDAPNATVDGRRTIALLPPYFKSIYDTTRTGTINVVTDSDNEVRWYYNYETLGGYRIPSLPYRMAQVLGWQLPARRSLINWPRGTTPYRTFSFVDAERAEQNRDAAFYRQFAGKIVLIGSTAPGLNDIKPTPVDHTHPAIYLLATVIDNIKNRGFLRPLGRAWLFGAEVLILAASVRLFTRTERSSAVAKYFVIIPAALAAISLLSVSVSDVLIDLSVPAAVFIGYFGIATIFETNSLAFQSGTGPFAPTPREVASGRLQVACLPASLPQSTIRAMLMRPGDCPIKLWTPQGAGLGKHWNGQGWVMWRWSTSSAPAEPGKTGAAPHDLDLHWHDVPAPGANGDAFCLAHAIAAAALDSPVAGPASPNPRAEPA